MDLKLARKPQVAAHMPPREAQDNLTYNLQRIRRWLPTHPRSPRQLDLQLARYTNTRHLDQKLAKKPLVAAHTPAGVRVACDWGW